MSVSTHENSLASVKTPPSVDKGTYGQILKSSAIVGGSQLLNIAIGMVRTKAMAVMLGPAGFAFFGLYSAVSNLVQTFAGMGINSSGVREIAAAVSTEENERIAQTVMVLRRVALTLGALGALLMVTLSRQISILTFASDRYAGSVRWLSIVVLFTLISNSQTALIQGMRRIADLAKMQILGSLIGSLCGIPLVYLFRERGIVPSLICVATVTVATSWWYSRKVRIPQVHIRNPQRHGSHIGREIGELLKLGVAFMISSLITLGVSYAIRVAVLHRVGVEATGLYQSAWTLGGLYVGFILQAMGTDFYPRLTAAIHDNMLCNRLVNEQALVGLLLAGPGTIASLTFAPLVISVFYSVQFGAAVSVLRWICLGAILQVISFSMGYVIVAKAKRAIFVSCEVAWGSVSIALAWPCIAWFGLTGAGISYFASYVFHCVMLYAIISKLTGFRWSREIFMVGVISLSLIAIVFFGFCLLPPTYAVLLGTLALTCDSIYSIRILSSLFAPEQIPRPLRRLLIVFGFLARQDAAFIKTS
jgi:antigen flippase